MKELEGRFDALTFLPVALREYAAKVAECRADGFEFFTAHCQSPFRLR